MDEATLLSFDSSGRSFSFNPEKHAYFLDGKIIPSVTRIVRFLDADVDRSRPWAGELAARRGSIVHSACALIDYGEPDVLDLLPPELHGYLTAYCNFLRDNRCEWKYIEAPFWCSYKGTEYAGTLDRYGRMNGVNTLLDIKTGSSSCKARHTAQLTGYLQFPGIDPDCFLYILNLRKDGSYKLVPHLPDEELWDACITLHDRTGGKA